jgi:hypothetical protein
MGARIHPGVVANPLLERVILEAVDAEVFGWSPPDEAARRVKSEGERAPW